MDAIKEPLDIITTQGGVLGALLVVAFAAIAFLAHQLIKTNNTNTKDIARIAENDAAVLASWTAANEARTRTLEASVRSQELATAANVALTSAVVALRDDIKSFTGALRDDTKVLTAEVRQLREAYLTRGGRLS